MKKRCRIPNFCVPSEAGFRKISESNNLVITGDCSSGCSLSNSTTYLYKIFKNTGDDTSFIWTELTDIEYQLVSGKKNNIK